MPRVAVLLDIDGTLLHTSGAGREAFRRALAGVFGRADGIDGVDFSGATDLDVLDRVLRPRGLVPGPEQIDGFFERLAVELEAGLASSPVHVFPGVRDLLAALSGSDGAVVGLLTGNTGRCARIKLLAAGLHGHFVLGAYGHEHADRRTLAGYALARVRRHVGGSGPDAVWVIGDTPLDVAAARAIGARALGVATGAFTADALRAAGADCALDNLSDTASILGILGLGGPDQPSSARAMPK